MRDTKALRSKTRLFLENKKQKTFVSEITSNPRGFLESIRKKGLEIHQRNNR